jgi:hypothetical protein
MPGITKNQVYHALAHRITPQRKSRGRRPILNTPKRKQLINYVIQNGLTRREQWISIPTTLGWDCGIEAIANAIDQEGYSRFLARVKPVLDEQTKRLHLQWAWDHVS